MSGGKYRNAPGSCQLLLQQKVDGLLDGLFPLRCALCGARAAGFQLCAGCVEDLPWLANGCRGCAMPLAAENRSGICAPCRAETSPPDYMLAALAYEYPVDRLVLALKFHGQQSLASLLGELLAIRVLTAGFANSEPLLLLPVPLHSRRYRERGFNQAELIAEVAGRMLAGRESIGPGLSFRRDCLWRTRPTPAQKGLGRRRRLANPDGSFAASDQVNGRQVVLIDDVITTGATAKACSSVLRDAGASGVSIWAVARSL